MINIHRLDTDQRIRYVASAQPRAKALVARSQDRTGIWTTRFGGQIVTASNLPALTDALVEIALAR